VLFRSHTKTQLSPEYFDLASFLLKNLADIAPTIVILGNHDFNINNQNRLDAVSPIVNSLNHKNLFFLEKTKRIFFENNFISFYSLSLKDKENWNDLFVEYNNMNICLFHGAISGCFTDTGYKIENSDIDIKLLKKFDFCMLGDIHIMNQIMDEEGRIRYAGSTLQQNFGEKNKKGYLLWNIKNKNEFSVEEKVFNRKNSFVTVNLIDENNYINNLNILPKSRVRIISENPISIEKLKNTSELIKQKYDLESIVFLKSNIINDSLLKKDLNKDFFH
jgi:DNA repair exonuclease SbcCD nuclease subunit